MKSILQSIKPQYCELIASGKKTIEVRKTRPKLDVPFKVYIYCTKGENLWEKGNSVFLDRRYNRLLQTFDYMLNGKVIGEYVCDRIEAFSPSRAPYETDSTITKASCLSIVELIKYSNADKPLYAWHISHLKMYDKPKELSEFEIINKEFLKECPYRIRVYNNPVYTNGALLKGPYVCNNSFEPDFCRGQCVGATKPLTHPPQSWCYVEEVGA